MAYKYVDNYREQGARKKLVDELKKKGIEDRQVLEAIGKIPRHYFFDETFWAQAYKDIAFPIGEGQTISQPYTVAYQTELLHIKKGDKVLEIGTGSGYQTTVLAKLSRLVYTVERYRTLLREAEARFKTLGLLNVVTKFGDGGEGWVEQAPFDRILVTAAAPDEPTRLISQLKPGGVLVAPVGKGPVQKLIRYAGDGTGGFKSEMLCEVRFVPLLEGVAREL